MAEQWTLGVFACIKDEPTKKRCDLLFPEAARRGPLLERIPWSAVGFHPHRDEGEAFEGLKRFFALPGDRAALLLFDRLDESGSSWDSMQPRPRELWVKELLNEFRGRLFGTIAILERVERVPLIDRVIRQRFEAAELLEALRLSAERLMYLLPVPRRPLPRPVVVRRIDDETELSAYFRLRHAVYRVMGYLDAKVEFAASRMELNSSDSGALHVGAFEQGKGGRQTLVGTARVVGVEDLDERSVGWTESLARYDPVLRSKLREALPLKLPIIHSMKMKESYKQMLTEERCAELSRVIVRDAYRGTGLSTVLTKFAIFAAAERGVDRLFLECLPVHVGMYAKLGFEAIEGVQGEVIDVNKTMVAMQMTPERLEHLKREEASAPALRVLREKRYLCAGGHDACYRGQYGYFLSPDCPLRP